jgi:hypothetical protein
MSYTTKATLRQPIFMVDSFDPEPRFSANSDVVQSGLRERLRHETRIGNEKKQTAERVPICPSIGWTRIPRVDGRIYRAKGHATAFLNLRGAWPESEKSIAAVWRAVN